MIIIIAWIVIGFLSYGFVHGAFDHEFPGQKNNWLPGVVAASCPLIGIIWMILTAIFCSGFHFRLNPRSRAERWEIYKKKYPALAASSEYGYKDFLRY